VALVRSKLPFFAAGLLWCLACAPCGHEVQNGRYSFRQVPIEDGLDTCGRLAADGSLPGGYLTRTGEEVHLDFSWVGPDDSIRLLGRFKAAVEGELDAFSAAGSVGGVSVEFGEAQCQVSFGQIFILATVPEGRDDQFVGTLTVGEVLPANQDPRCPQRGDIRVGFEADLVR